MTERKMTRISRADLNDERGPDPGTTPDLVLWVQTQIARGCTTITMRQRADDGETLVCMWTLPGEGAEVIAANIDTRASAEGRFLRGPTLFVLYAFKDLAREHVDRKTMRIEGDTFPKSGETEPPNLSGVTSMLMRHAEGATKIALGHTSNIIEQYKVLLAQSQRRIAELETALRDSSAMRESLVTLEHERALSLHRAKLEEKRTDFLREKLDLLFPVVAGKFFQGITGPNTVITDESLKQFLGSLSNEQLAQMMGVLTPEQQTVMGDLYFGYAGRAKDADVAAAAKDAAAAANGSAPA